MDDSETVDEITFTAKIETRRDEPEISWEKNYNCGFVLSSSSSLVLHIRENNILTYSRDLFCWFFGFMCVLFLPKTLFHLHFTIIHSHILFNSNASINKMGNGRKNCQAYHKIAWHLKKTAHILRAHKKWTVIVLSIFFHWLFWKAFDVK